jgi:hypothetical protein
MTLAFRIAGLAFSAMGALLFGLAPVAAGTPQLIDRVEERCDNASMHVETESCYRDAVRKIQVAIERSFHQKLQAASALDRRLTLTDNLQAYLGRS